MANNIKFDSNGINLAFTEVSDKVHPRLTEHSKTFEQGIYHLDDKFYLGVGYAVANSFMAVANNSIIIIDMTETIEAGENVFNDFRKYTNLPISTCIYTHNHLDHIGGIKAFTNTDDVNNGIVKIYAHDTLMDDIRNMTSNVGDILNRRAVYTFGLALENGEEGQINDGLGPRIIVGHPTFIPPTDTFSDELELTVSGLKIKLIYAPSETDNEIMIYFPDYKVLQSADILMGESYPNLHSIRGTKYRDPVQWINTIDKMRSLRPKYIFPSHGRPIEGEDNIYEMLTAYRDAIQFTHDQTVRYMNKGLTPDELVEIISELPENLRNHPWLGEFYGTVKHCVRQIYQGYLGWFKGDPTFLDPLPKKERAEKHIKIMGGRESIMNEAVIAFENKDFKWAAEILTYLITFDKTDIEAKELKSECLKELGYKCMNTNWRNWYITSAKELDGTFNHEYVKTIHGVDAKDITAEIPVEMMLRHFCVKLNTEKSSSICKAFQFDITDIDEQFILEIRHCVLEFHHNNDSFGNIIDHSIKVSSNILKSILLRRSTFASEIDNENIICGENTNLDMIRDFLSYFDLEKEYPVLTQPHI